MSLKVTLLGTGTSHGVPMIGCECAVCRSTDPHDKRTRPSILVELREDGSPAVSAWAGDVRTILVDTSTDIRMQALTRGVKRVDAILFTHSHADHILGLDEVRRFNVMQKAAMPCFGDAQTLADLRTHIRVGRSTGSTSTAVCRISRSSESADRSPSVASRSCRSL